MGLSGCDCEDVVQQCFRRISEHIGTFEYDRSVGRFRSWLKVIAANEVRKHFRDRAPASAPQECLTVIPALGDDPEEVFERHWMREHLWHCVRQMRAEVDEPTYAAFHAYVFEETSIDDICAKLNMNPAQVYNIKSRLTRHVARKMRKFFGEEA